MKLSEFKHILVSALWETTGGGHFAPKEAARTLAVPVRIDRTGVQRKSFPTPELARSALELAVERFVNSYVGEIELEYDYLAKFEGDIDRSYHKGYDDGYDQGRRDADNDNDKCHKG